MKKLLLFSFVLIVIAQFYSCKKDLNVKPVDKYSDASVWGDPALAQTFVNNIYGGIPHGFSNVMMSSISDEAVYNANGGDWDVVKSLITPSNLMLFDYNWWTSPATKLRGWGSSYKYIRACDLFFDKIDGVPFTDSSAKFQMEGEVHFLRAYLYFDLMELYGGVPIITKAYALDDSTNVARNTFEETANFIISELDAAASLLPTVPLKLDGTSVDKGRATKGAALALKARTLLYVASDFYNNNASWAGSYSHPELVGYTGGDRAARWQAAKDACKAVMDLGIYSLYGSLTPATAEEATTNYSNIFLLQETSEDIFVKYFTTKVDENWDGTKKITVAGVDTRQSQFENWNGTHTGYFMRKFMDPSVDAQNYKQTVPWRYMRYTEILLDYAEACLGLGQEDEAKTYINMIRARAKMPPITSSGSQLTTDYRNERRIELAFEDHRYYDIRRWLIADVAYANSAQAAFALYPLNPDHTTSTQPKYSISVAQPRLWDPRFYMLPVALDEINRNPLLIQNPLY